jgi:prepilin-type N-terminal cleavage/methylation domain-containing protein
MGSPAATPASEDGFTLIELMVVVLIIGILIAIALGTYSGARQRAADKAAESDIRTGLVTAMSHYVDKRTYDGFDVPTARTAEPSLDWMSPGPPDKTQIDIEVVASTSPTSTRSLSAPAVGSFGGSLDFASPWKPHSASSSQPSSVWPWAVS